MAFIPIGYCIYHILYYRCVQRMRPVVLILVALSALRCSSPSFGLSVHSPADDAVYVKGSMVTSNDLLIDGTEFTVGVGNTKDNAAVNSASLIAKGAILLGILFLIVRCATYIPAVSHFPVPGEKPLADKDPCGEKVSNRRCICEGIGKGKVLSPGLVCCFWRFLDGVFVKFVQLISVE